MMWRCGASKAVGFKECRVVACIQPSYANARTIQQRGSRLQLLSDCLLLVLPNISTIPHLTGAPDSSSMKHQQRYNARGNHGPAA